MTSIADSISAQFGKGLLLGTALPVLLVVLLLRFLLLPLLPPAAPFLGQFTALSLEWQALVGTLAVVVCSGLLFNLNTLVIRWFEGYPWQDTRVGRRRVAAHQAYWRAAQARREKIAVLREALRAQAGHQAFDEADRALDTALGAEWARLSNMLRDEFPPELDSVLPTCLGNTIRSFESYPQRQYGMQAVTLWPRLAAIIDKDYNRLLDEAKATFDFMLHCCVFSALLAVALTLAALVYPTGLTPVERWLPIVGEIAACVVAVVAFYYLARQAAVEWGLGICGAFDLYRRSLLRQLGYDRDLRTPAEERRLWEQISYSLAYGDTALTPLPDYTVLDTRLDEVPPQMRLELTRGITPSDTSGIITITLRITNQDEYVAREMLVADPLPRGFAYVMDSATIDAPTWQLRVVGTEPCEFRLEEGKLAPKETITLRYKIAPLRRPRFVLAR
jgi:uncharacterized repeat protein (TIGR01451 family)